MKNKSSHLCKICGDVEYSGGFCYRHRLEIRELNIINEDIDKIKSILSEKDKNSAKLNEKNKQKMGCCKICGKPTIEELCIIHQKINEYINKNRDNK